MNLISQTSLTVQPSSMCISGTSTTPPMLKEWCCLLLIWLICLQMLSFTGLVSIIFGYITFVIYLLCCERHIRPFALLAFGNMVFNYVSHLVIIPFGNFITLG